MPISCFCTYGVDKFGLDMQLCNNIIYFHRLLIINVRWKGWTASAAKGIARKLNIYDFLGKTNLEQLINDNLERKRTFCQTFAI